MNKHYFPRVLSEIFGPGRSASFNSAMPKQMAKDALLAALKPQDGKPAAIRLVGDIDGDDLRIKCIIQRDGILRRDYTTFVGSIKETDGGCEVAGSYVAPLHGKILMAVIVVVTFVFAVADLINSIQSGTNAVQWLRGPIMFALVIGLAPYLFGVNKEQTIEICEGICKALGGAR